MELVYSSDGTPIAYQRTGTGPPLILVHGGVTDHNRWNPLLPFLENRFTVYAIDRRGRGGSGEGDSEAYSWYLEADDVAAVANSLDEPVNLYGHSSGGTYSLEAAPKIRNLRRLVLYEPPTLPEMVTGSIPPGLVDRLQHLLDAGDRENVIVTFLREIARMPQHEIEHLRTLPQWPSRVSTASAVPRELRASYNYRFDPGRFEELRIPTLLLVGSDSPAPFRRSAEAVQAALPNCQTRKLPGQQHLADVMAPEMVADALVPFLLEEREPIA